MGGREAGERKYLCSKKRYGSNPDQIVLKERNKQRTSTLVDALAFGGGGETRKSKRNGAGMESG